LLWNIFLNNICFQQLVLGTANTFIGKPSQNEADIKKAKQLISKHTPTKLVSIIKIGRSIKKKDFNSIDFQKNEFFNGFSQLVTALTGSPS